MPRAVDARPELDQGVGSGTLQDGVDRLLIEAHPDLFPDFYAFPFYTNREMLPRLRDFLFAGMARCGGSMRAVCPHTRDRFAVFGQRDKLFPEATQDWLRSHDCVRRFTAFCETCYPESASMRATARFYRQVHAQAPCVRAPGSEPVSHACR